MGCDYCDCNIRESSTDFAMSPVDAPIVASGRNKTDVIYQDKNMGSPIYMGAPGRPVPDALNVIVEEHEVSDDVVVQDGWHTCLKQVTRCVVMLAGIGAIQATNACHVEDATVCPRVTANCKTGEGYDLCGPPKHAEQEAAKKVLERFPDGAPEGSVAYLFGHTYLCGPCQEALVAAGVRTHVITGEPA